MDIYGDIPQIPYMRPCLNVGSIFDLVTGAGVYHIGKHGESILNGGLPSSMAVAGPPNSFKTAIVKYFDITAAARYKSYVSMTYDTEGSYDWDRLSRALVRHPDLAKVDWSDATIPSADRKFWLSSNETMLGNAYLEIIKDIANAKRKLGDKINQTTPFIDASGKNFVTRRPTGVSIDSLSAFTTDDIQDKVSDKNIGDSELNTWFMRDGLVKKQMLNQIPRISSMSYGNMYFMFTAHIGDEFDIGGRFAPQKHKMTHAKKGSKMTGVTKALEFLTSIIFEIWNVKPLNNSTHKTGVKYPKTELDRQPDCVDLLEIMVKPTRNKRGGSGLPLYIVVSQREGLLPHLTQLHNMIEHSPFGQWGFEGNTGANYRLALLPDVALSRTKVRDIIDTDEKVRRAIEISCDMMQIKYYMDHLDDDFVPTPGVLRADLIAKGYDWDQLLATRPYWVPLDEEKGLPNYLSTYCLLRMRKGLYHPKWATITKK